MLESAAAANANAGDLLYRHLRPLHRRSERPKLHSLALLSVVVWPQPGVLHHAVSARHWKAPVIDHRSYSSESVSFFGRHV